MTFTVTYLICMKEWKVKKFKKLVDNFHDKKEYVIHVKNSKQTLNHGFVLTKVYRGMKFNQNAYLKSYIDTNTKLSKWIWAKNDFEKDFFKLMNNVVMEFSEKIQKI